MCSKGSGRIRIPRYGSWRKICLKKAWGRNIWGMRILSLRETGMSGSSKRVSIQASRNRRKSSWESKRSFLVEASRPIAGPLSDRRFLNLQPKSPQRLPTGLPPWNPKKNLYKNPQGSWQSTRKVLTRRNEILPRLTMGRNQAPKKNLAWSWATVFWINNPANPKTLLDNFFPITSGRLWATGG